jgi:tripartite-type tricarboxylate transporter receptor subunit TctC
MHRRTAILAAARGLATTLSSASAAWPDRPIKLVVPYAPGGSTDQFGRGIAEGVSRELKQPVLVENRPGANTMIGTQSVARAAGRLHGAAGHQREHGAESDALQEARLRAAGVQDHHGRRGSAACVVVNNQVPSNNIKEFAAYAKAANGKLNYSSVGLGNSLQLPPRC